MQAPSGKELVLDGAVEGGNGEGDGIKDVGKGVGFIGKSTAESVFDARIVSP